jgi:NMD protein affecting ribosome stability and mRNA decay
MKLLKISPNGKMVNIGYDEKSASWYHLDTVVLKDIKIGDEVSFKFEKRGGSKYLTQLVKGNVQLNPPQTTAQKSDKPSTIVKESKDTEESTKTTTTVVSSDQKRVAIGQMTAETLIALQGKVTETNVIDLIDKIYNKYVQKVG